MRIWCLSATARGVNLWASLLLSMVPVAVTEAQSPPEPVGFWRFEENSGSTAVDSGTGGNHGTLKGDAAFVNDAQRGNCIELSGSGYVDIGAWVVEMSDPFTIVAWIKTCQVGMCIVSKSDGDGEWERHEKQFYVADPALEGQSNGGVELAGYGCDWIRNDDSASVDDGQWHHVAVTWNRRNAHIYVDGVAHTGSSDYADCDDNPGDGVRIGFGPGEHSANFIGRIDDVGIYNLALAEHQIAHVLNNGLSRTVGHTTVFTGRTTDSNRRAMPFIMPENGVIESVAMWHRGGGDGDLLFGIYTGEALPGTRIAVTPQNTIDTQIGWQTVALISAVYVESGTKIWLAWVYQDNPGIAVQDGTPSRADSGVGWTSGMPEEFGASTIGTTEYSIYATYMPAGGPPDDEPPEPNPPTWALPPAAIDHGSIIMTADEATDLSAVEYYFEETSGNPGGNDSGWQQSNTYTDLGLSPQTDYTYRIKTHDLSPRRNESLWSVPASATTAETSTACPEGDLSGDCRASWEDVLSFALQWLDPPGCPEHPDDCADLDEQDDGIDFEDFAILADDWHKKGIVIAINELMASNDRTIADPQGEYDDWIEICNASSISIDIGGLWIADDGNRWQIPADRPGETTIDPDGYLLVWADDDASDSPGLHASFKLDRNADQVNLYDRDGITLIDSISFDGQTADISHGRYPDGIGRWYDMSDPTPGLPNTVGMAAAPHFSHPGGTFADPFVLGLTTKSPNATIYYTIDGTRPGDGRGRIYGRPFTVSGTTWVRARVYEPSLAPSPIVSQTYIKLDNDVDDFASNLPIVLIDSFGRDIDPEAEGSRPHRPVSMVFIDTDAITGRAAVTDPADFAGYGGMHVRGSSSTSYAKKQYKFETWDEYDQDKDVSILGFPPESDWILHGPYSDKTLMRNFQMYTWNQLVGRYGVRCRFVEAFIDDDGDGRIEWDRGNGPDADYRGVYVFMEKIKRSDDRINIERLDRTHNTEPEITGGYIFKKDWERDFETAIYRDDLAYVYPAREDITRPQKDWLVNYLNKFETVLSGPNFRDPTDGYTKYIDVGSWVDHHILVEIARNVDGYVLSTYLFKDRGGKLNMGPIWDYNGSLGGADYFQSYRIQGWHYENPEFPADNPQGYRWYQRIFEDPEFPLKYADRWFELREDLFSTSNMLADIDDNVSLLTDGGAADNAVNRNFHRWPVLNQYIWPNYRVLGSYEAEVDWLRSWLTDRLDWMDSAISNQYGTAPPTICINGVPENIDGYISSTDVLSIIGGTGTIWYTLDGSDPRLSSTTVPQNINTLAAENTAKQVLVPTSAIGSDWRSGQPFDDSAWIPCMGSPGGVGYERTWGYEGLISLDVQEQMYGQSATCYIRIPFAVSSDELAGFGFMTLLIRYDDGFVAYLNGAEVARGNFTGAPAWDSRATRSHSDSAAVVFESFDISDFVGLLQPGDNLLAIQGMNASTTSSDFLISAELIAGESIPADDNLSPSAIEYTAPITLTKSTRIKARVLDGSAWSALNEATFALGPVAENLRITEIMYHPQDPPQSDPNAEFIELKNIGTETINLNLVSFTGGIDFTFPSTDLDPGDHIVVVKDRTAFASQHPGFAGTIAGEYAGQLDNAGERIELQDALGRTIHSFGYKDGWYAITDGHGFSLNIINPDSPDTNSWEYKEHWRPASIINGTPGAADNGHFAPNGAIVINEVLTHTDDVLYGDWIELHNTTSSPINIGGWFLSDDKYDLSKYEISAGTYIPANGYKVFTAVQNFHNPGDPGCNTPFGLSELGEILYLSSGASGALAGGYSAKEDFKAAENGATFGRYAKSTASGKDVDFVAMAHPTKGAANTSGPQLGLIVISEIMYHPRSNAYAEYIELRNTTAADVQLYDPAHPWNTWRLFDENLGIDYYMPSGTSIPANGYLLLVKNKIAFHSKFTPADGVQIFEWVEGSLSNGGEKIQISKPVKPQPDGFVPYVRIDRVNYSDGSHHENFHELDADPWPVEPDGAGESLTRISASAYGNDPVNWLSAEPTPGH